MAKILVADDDECIRETTGDCLRSFGHEIILACDGADALHKARSENVDLVVTDFNMPGFSGMEMLQVLREVHRCMMPVILCHGGIDIGEHEALAAGFAGFVQKPQLFPKLARMVDAVLAPSE